MKYEIDIRVIKDGSYQVYINDYFLDFWGDNSSLSRTNAKILKGIMNLDSLFNTGQLEQHLIENCLYEPPQPPTKLTVAEIEQKLGVTNLEIVGDD